MAWIRLVGHRAIHLLGFCDREPALGDGRHCDLRIRKLLGILVPLLDYSKVKPRQFCARVNRSLVSVFRAYDVDYAHSVQASGYAVDAIEGVSWPPIFDREPRVGMDPR